MKTVLEKLSGRAISRDRERSKLGVTMKRPESHRGVSFEDMARFSVHEEGRACLDGKPIEVQRMTLSKWQVTVGLIGARGPALGGLSAFATFILSLLG